MNKTSISAAADSGVGSTTGGVGGAVVDNPQLMECRRRLFLDMS